MKRSLSIAGAALIVVALFLPASPVVAAFPGANGDLVFSRFTHGQNDLWALDPAGDRMRWTGIHPRCLAQMADRGVPYALPPAAETEAAA